MTRDNPDDVIGLVAYALYKKMIREDVIEGVRIAGKAKNPSDATVEFYRNSAQQVLQTFAANAIDEAAPEIQQSALLDRVETMGSELQQHITKSTGTGRAIWTNIVGWAVTIAFTVLALIAVRLPDVAEEINGIIPDLSVPATPDADPALPTSPLEKQ